MRTRRELLKASGAALCIAATSPVSFAQQKGKVWRVGFLGLESASGSAQPFDALKAGLRDLGYVEGRNFVFESRWADGKHERLSALAVELVKARVDVIVTYGAAASAAQRATATIPIVLGTSSDALRTGLVSSLARPGTNMTGLTNIAVELSSKYLELLRAAVPGLSRVGVLVHSNQPSHPVHWKNIQTSAQTMNVKVSEARVSAASEIDAAFGALKRERAGGLIVLPTAVFFAQAQRIAQLAIQDHLPTMFWTREAVEAGALMSYGPSLVELFRQTATYVDKIFKGAKPQDLPIEQPTKIELVINLKTAKAIGLTIPQNLLFRADKVIE